MKDIFIDNDIAKCFAAPPNEHYQELINWLLKNDEVHPENNAIIVYSDYLYNEYVGGCALSDIETTIGNIIDKMIQQNRYIKIKKTQISDFQNRYFSQRIWDSLQCKRRGSHDPEHIPVVFLSHRKFVLTKDDDFTFDLINFPKFKKSVCVKNSPELINYK